MKHRAISKNKETIMYLQIKFVVSFITNAKVRPRLHYTVFIRKRYGNAVL